MQKKDITLEQQHLDPPATSAKNGFETQKTFRAGMAYGHFVYRFRWFILTFWLIALVVSVPFATRILGVLSGGGYSFSGSESVHANNLLIDKLHTPLSQVTIVFQSSHTSVVASAYQQEVHSVLSKIRTFHNISSITQGVAGQDGRTTYIMVGFNQDYDYMHRYMADFRALLPQGGHASPARVYLTDQLAVVDELSTTTQQDAERADIQVLPIALLILLIVFGTLTAAVMPLLLSLMAIPITLAVLYPVAQSTSVSTFVTSVVSIIGLGISIDYSLLITRRFREELAENGDVRDAIARTLATAGEAILFSAFTVMIGFTGLMLIGISMMTSLGIGGVTVVAVAVLAGLTLLPALLSVLNWRINRLRVPWLWRFSMGKAAGANGTRKQSFWHRLAMGVMHRPVIVIVGVCALLVTLGWPVFSLNVGTDSANSLPASSQVRQGYSILAAQYPAFNENPLDLVVQSTDGSSLLTTQNLNRIVTYTQWLSRQSHVTGVISLVTPPTTPGSQALSQQQLLTLYSTGAYKQVPELTQLVKATTNGGLTSITVNTDTQLDSSAGKALVDHLREAHNGPGTGLSVLVGGIQATYLDFSRYVYSNFPKAILYVLGATFILLLIMFRSILLPLKAVIVNGLSVGAAYGVLVFVFQWGNFSHLLGFTSSGFIDSLIPILLFCVLFGLSMDYEVFLLSRIYEEWRATHDNTQAVALGLEKTGSVITNAALLFVVVTVAFTFTQIIVTKELGLGMTVAVLVDATVVRSLLVPATMRLLGHWNWWLPFKRTSRAPSTDSKPESKELFSSSHP